MNELLQNFHFLRPQFLWLLPLAVFAVIAIKNSVTTNNSWQQVIDKSLLPHLLNTGNHKKRSKWLTYTLNGSLATIWLISCLALAGPSWEQIKQPVVKKQDALIIVLDLSLSMYAEDQKPSRIIAAQRKLSDILAQRKEGLTALIAYSGDAHVVSPLTDDTETIATLLPALEPKIMPKYGSNLTAAIVQANTLMKNAVINKAKILILTDEIRPEQLDQAMAIVTGDTTTTILTFGSKAGAPIPLPQPFKQGFMKDDSGATIIAQLNQDSLKNAARKHGILVQSSRLDDKDIALILTDTLTEDKNSREQEKREFDIWQDRGHWLTLLLIPLLLLSFRRGFILAAMVMIMPIDGFAAPTPSTVLSSEQPSPQVPSLDSDIATAAEPTTHTWQQRWKDLWNTSDQQAASHFDQQQYSQAASQFKDRQWQASSYYKNGDYEKAAASFAQSDDASSHYNRGNALAHMGKLDEAIAAYNNALKKDPNLQDAKTNKALLEQLRQQQKEQEQQQEQKGEQGEDGEQQDGQQSQKNQEGEQQDGQQSEKNQEGEQQDGQQSDDPQQGSEGEQQETDAQSESSEPSTEEQDQEQAQQSQTQQPERGEELSEEQKQQLLQQAAEAQMSPEQREQQQALQQWLRRLPEDSGTLLKNKFQHQYQQNRRNNDLLDKDSEQLW